MDICRLCSNDDFGLCGLRDDPKELLYIHEKSELVKCSGFRCDTEKINRMFGIGCNECKYNAHITYHDKMYCRDCQNKNRLKLNGVK
jgi:hypothetical protein